MNILTLCNEINLQPEIKSRVLAFADSFDFGTVEEQLKDFLVYEKIKEARIKLQAVLGTDWDGIKILACMMKASADAYGIYKEKGISDEIYFATMKCYPRFINETMEMTGRLSFDRYWWTARQAGCHLFRIGELEYEMKQIAMNKDNEKAIETAIEIAIETAIEIHIPSDADFSLSAVDQSFAGAKSFFAEYFPAFRNAEYRCCSWLLDSRLKEMLSENSNIVSFQRRFEIFDEGEADTEFMEWLFQTKSAKAAEYKALPENTSLQRNMKKYLLSGGVICNAYGRLKQ